MDLLDYCIANTSIHTMIAHEYSRNIETLAAHPESRINAPTPTRVKVSKWLPPTLPNPAIGLLNERSEIQWPELRYRV
jgi:hypothetical protein